MSVTLAAGFLSAAWAADYHVDCQRGNDANDGLSPARAFATLARATSCLAPGDTLNLAPGQTFHESLSLRKGGTAAAPVVIRGGGAVLCGLSPLPRTGWRDEGGGLYFLPRAGCCKGALRPRVFLGEGRMISVACRHYNDVDPKGLQALTAVWRGDGIWFRAEDGKGPSDYDLRGMLLGGGIGDSGVLIRDCSHIVIENLTATGFPNDGFNVHGFCYGLIFRNVVGRWNGDDGFSIHEDVHASVYHGHFHHNDFGIQDINASQSSFFGCTVESNRLCGVDLYGGMRVLNDTVVRGNAGGQIRISTNAAKHLGFEPANPMLSAQAYLKNVRVEGGAGVGIAVGRNARACLSNCRVADCDVGLSVRDDGILHAICTRVRNCRKPIDDSKAVTKPVLRACP